MFIMNHAYRRIVKTAAYYSASHLTGDALREMPCTAIIDTGIFPHRDLSGRIIGFYDPLNKKLSPYDDNGHGTHISGIAAGRCLNAPQKYSGIFPRCRLFGVKALNKKGTGKIQDFIAGTEYLIKNREKYNIRVINISLGAEYDNSAEHHALIDCVEHAWDCGITVCAAAGNNGPEKGSITVPGISKKIITVGTYDDNIPITIDSSGTKLANYSGRGPTSECIVKPDILCPGAGIMSLKNALNGYTVKSGTSMSTPMITGAVSLITAVHPDITPKELKKAVKESHFPDSLIFDCNLFFSRF